jgi:hypothetical protein
MGITKLSAKLSRKKEGDEKCFGFKVDPDLA